MAHPSYRRGQVEWALSQLARQKRGSEGKAEEALRNTRIKRLLDADREVVLPAHAVALASPYAFGEAAPVGTGGETCFSAFDIYCLWIGLRLLGLGFKQGEVAAALRLVRPHLKKAYLGVLRRTPLPPKQIRLGDPPPKRRTPDYRAFLVLRGVDLIEVIRGDAVADDVKALALNRFASVFANANLLHHHLEMNFAIDADAVLLEIGGAALTLRRVLKDAPDKKRGRPPA